jgi:hypothetical protein
MQEATNPRLREAARQHRRIWEQYVAQTGPLYGRNRGDEEQLGCGFRKTNPMESIRRKVTAI